MKKIFRFRNVLSSGFKLVLFCLLMTKSVYSQTWSGVGYGMGDWVNASTVYNGSLIVGGRFTNAGGVSANYIAKWNGTSWSALGTGMDGWVNALTVYNGELIAGGSFTTAGGVVVNNIARWDGTTWTDVSGGTNSIVAALTVYNNKLIVGGYFTDAEGVPVNYIGAWDNNGWTTLGSGMGGGQRQVMALTVHGTDLIAAGFFTSAGGVAANHIAKWNGTTWSPVGSGINWIVYSLANYGTALIAGGLFDACGSVAASSIASWNGTAWSPLGSGIGATIAGSYKYVFALEVYHGSLYAGGMYLTAGGLTANGIAKWNGSSWSDLNGGVWYGGSNAYGVNTLKVYNNQLYAGGLFTSAGTVGVAHIARWSEQTLPVQLTAFTGRKESLVNVLNWETATEQSCDHFIIQRSRNGNGFEQAGNVKAQGNSSQLNRYEWRDNIPYSKTIYRSASVDKDGQMQYSKTIEIDRLTKDFTVYPTIFTNYIQLNGPEGLHKLNLQIRDFAGKLIAAKSVSIDGSGTINLSALLPGWYFLTFENEQSKYSFKVLKQ